MRTSLYEKGGGRMTGFFLANIILLLSTGFMIVAAQEALTVAAGGDKASIPEQAWSFLQTGKLSASARYRFELYEREQAAFPHAAEASTLRLALGYETPTVYGFSAFAEYEGVFVLGVDNYDVPGVPGQTKPGYPTILDPGANELNQGWVRWKWGETNFQATLTAGRQEIILNDNWGIRYTGEVANQQDFARNPNQVNANYWLGELGAAYQSHTLKAGLAWL